MFAANRNFHTFVARLIKKASFYGDVAQLVEQRTENPCVGGSIPSITTQTLASLPEAFVFLFLLSQFYYFSTE